LLAINNSPLSSSKEEDKGEPASSLEEDNDIKDKINLYFLINFDN